MAITRDDVIHLAKLARLTLTDDEIDRFGRELEKISEYVEQLSQLASDSGDSHDSVLPLIKSAEALRDDVAKPWFSAKEATAGAPDAGDGFFRVPRVIDRHDSDSE